MRIKLLDDLYLKANGKLIKFTAGKFYNLPEEYVLSINRQGCGVIWEFIKPEDWRG